MSYQNHAKAGSSLNSSSLKHPLVKGKIHIEVEPSGVVPTIERAQYEYRPYIFLAISLITLTVAPKSTVGIVSSWLLLIVSFAILQMRAKNRGGWFQ